MPPSMIHLFIPLDVHSNSGDLSTGPRQPDPLHRNATTVGDFMRSVRLEDLSVRVDRLRQARVAEEEAVCLLEEAAVREETCRLCAMSFDLIKNTVGRKTGKTMGPERSNEP